MSRYTLRVIKDGKEYEVAYGYDRPLMEYFIQVFDNTMPEDEECILWEGNYMTDKSNSEMYRLFEKWSVPKEHLELLAMDLPF